VPTSRRGNEDPRIEERSNVFLGASIESQSKSFPVRIRNISATGALIDGAGLPGDGARGRLSRAKLSVDCEVAWQNGDLRGIRFDVPIDTDAWVRSGEARKRTVRRQTPRAPLTKPALDEVADELLEIAEQLFVSADLSFEDSDRLKRVRELALSLKDRGEA